MKYLCGNRELIKIELKVDGVINDFFVEKEPYERGERVPLMSFEELYSLGRLFVIKDDSK